VRLLDAACANDADMRARIEALLSADAESGNCYLATPQSVINILEPLHNKGLPVVAAGDLIAERYRLIRQLGEGGMGQVWLAEQTTPFQRHVALKLIKAGMHDEAVIRSFASEQQSLQIMDHPAIAKVFDAGATSEGQPYFIMEYVPGLSITAFCDLHRTSLRGCLEILIQACEGVQHAHQKAVIHRDLKPANILVVDVNDKPAAKIIDFGLARIADAERREEARQGQHTQFFGTPGFISPEQVDPDVQEIDTRTDVYSLGVILYMLLTGLQPFEWAQAQELPFDALLRRLREEDPRRPSARLLADRNIAIEAAEARSTHTKTLVRELRRDLDWIAIKALQRERERRYATPSELAADLRRYLRHEPVHARPPSTRYRIHKFVRRRASNVFAALLNVLASGLNMTEAGYGR